MNSIICHLSKKEIEDLTLLQGENLIDKRTGLRSFDKLEPLSNSNNFRNIFEIISQNPTNLPTSFKQILNSNSFPQVDIGIGIEEKKGTPHYQLAQKGKKDKTLALIPKDLVNLFIRENPEYINEDTGLPEFFKLGNILKSVVRVASTIGGALVGGPAGAAIGNTVGNLTTGNSFKNSLLGGAKNALFTQGANNLLGGIPSLSSALSTTATTLGLPAFLTSGLSGGQENKNDSVNLIPNEKSSEGIPDYKVSDLGKLVLDEKKKKEEAPFSFTNFLQGLNKNKAFSNILTDTGEKALKYDRALKEHEKQKASHEKILRLMREYDEREPRVEQEADLIVNVPSFKKGGKVSAPSSKKSTLIEGPGRGQDDVIKTSVYDGDYIIDASSVANIGDGSTSAGAAALHDFCNFMKDYYPTIKGERKRVPVFLSDAEFKIDRDIVTAIGGGDNKKGADRLRNMVEKLRLYKISKGKKLPPPTGNLLRFIELPPLEKEA